MEAGHTECAVGERDTSLWRRHFSGSGRMCLPGVKEGGKFLAGHRHEWIGEQLPVVNKECILMNQERFLVRSMEPPSGRAFHGLLR